MCTKQPKRQLVSASVRQEGPAVHSPNECWSMDFRVGSDGRCSRQDRTMAAGLQRQQTARSALGDLTPEEFAGHCISSASPTVQPSEYN